MTVLEDPRFLEEPEEEFLEAKEEAEMDPEAEKPVFGNVDPEFQDQKTEDIVIMNDNTACTYQIVNHKWLPYARAIWKKFDTVQDCNPSKILYLEVKDSKPKYRGKPKIMDVSVMSKRWSEILRQLTDKSFTHIITIYTANVDKYEQNYEQMLVHLYIAMRQIKADGSLRDYDMKAFSEVYANLKSGWDKENEQLSNLIDTGSWIGMKRLQGTLFGEDRSGENNLAKNF